MVWILVALLTISAVLLLKPHLAVIEHEPVPPELPSIPWYLMYGLSLYFLGFAAFAVTWVIWRLTRPGQIVFYRVIGLIMLVAAGKIAADNRPGRVSLSGGQGTVRASSTYIAEVIAGVAEGRPDYIVWESSTNRVEVIDPGRMIAVSYNLIADLHSGRRASGNFTRPRPPKRPKMKPEDRAAAILQVVEKELNARHQYLTSNNELAPVEEKYRKLIERKGLKPLAAQKPSAPPAPAPPTEAEVLARVEQMLKTAGTSWTQGRSADALREADAALALCTQHLGPDHPQTKNVKAMVDAARR